VPLLQSFSRGYICIPRSLRRGGRATWGTRSTSFQVFGRPCRAFDLVFWLLPGLRPRPPRRARTLSWATILRSLREVLPLRGLISGRSHANRGVLPLRGLKSSVRHADIEARPLIAMRPAMNGARLLIYASDRRGRSRWMGHLPCPCYKASRGDISAFPGPSAAAD
jgi:hypothetical protein